MATGTAKDDPCADDSRVFRSRFTVVPYGWMVRHFRRDGRTRSHRRRRYFLREASRPPAVRRDGVVRGRVRPMGGHRGRHLRVRSRRPHAIAGAVQPGAHHDDEDARHAGVRRLHVPPGAGRGRRYPRGHPDLGRRSVASHRGRRGQRGAFEDNAWADALGGLRVRWAAAERWRVSAAGDGGGGGSKGTGGATATVGYDVSSRWTLFGAYRYLFLNRRTDESFFTGHLGGPAIGGAYRW